MNIRETHIIGGKTREWIVLERNCPALKEHQIATIGLSDAAVPYRMIRLRPEHFHILICTGGEGRVWVDGHWKACRTGQAYLSPPAPLMGFHAIPLKRWQFVWVYYHSTAPILSSHPKDKCTLRDCDPVPFETALRGLYHEVLHRRDDAVVSSWTHLLNQLCFRLLRTLSAPLRLNSLWQQVEGNPAQSWNMRQLAHHAGISEEHVRRIALAEMGRSPMKQVTFIRMQKAALLLQTTHLKIESVAEAVGYRNPFAFSTAFKRHFKCSPSTFLLRQKQQEPH